MMGESERMSWSLKERIPKVDESKHTVKGPTPFMAINLDRTSSLETSPPRSASEMVPSQKHFAIEMMHLHFVFDRPAGACSLASTLLSLMESIRSGDKMDVCSSVAPTTLSRRRQIIRAALPASCCPDTIQQINTGSVTIRRR